MMTTTLMVALTALVFAYSNADHRVIVDMQPSIAKVSKSLSSLVQGKTEAMEDALTGVVSNHLAMQVDKFYLLTNGTLDSIENGPPSNWMCCSCNTCSRSCRMCGKTCCCKGSGGCRCRSCSTGLEMTLDEMGMGLPSTLKQWVRASKDELRRQVTQVLSLNSPSNVLCCSCETCQRKQNGCGVGSCCAEGSDCVCRKCASNTVDFVASNIKDPVSLAPELETAVAQVEDLVDNLLARLTRP